MCALVRIFSLNGSDASVVLKDPTGISFLFLRLPGYFPAEVNTFQLLSNSCKTSRNTTEDEILLLVFSGSRVTKSQV